MFPGALSAAGDGDRHRDYRAELEHRGRPGPLLPARRLYGKVRQDLIDADAQTLSTTLHDQCLVDYAEINFARAGRRGERATLLRGLRG